MSHRSWITGHAGHGSIDWWLMWVMGHIMWPIVGSVSLSPKGYGCISAYDNARKGVKPVKLQTKQQDTDWMMQFWARERKVDRADCTAGAWINVPEARLRPLTFELRYHRHLASDNLKHTVGRPPAVGSQCIPQRGHISQFAHVL